MRYEIIIPSPFDGNRMMLRLPLDIIGISREDGERFISVSGFNATFDESGEPYAPIQREIDGV